MATDCGGNHTVRVKPVATRRQRDMGVKVAHIPIKTRHFFHSDIGWIGHNQVKFTLHTLKPIALRKTKSITNIIACGIFAGYSQGSGADISGQSLRLWPLCHQRNRKNTTASAKI